MISYYRSLSTLITIKMCFFLFIFTENSDYVYTDKPQKCYFKDICMLKTIWDILPYLCVVDFFFTVTTKQYDETTTPERHETSTVEGKPF